MNEEEIIKYIENVINTIKESDMLFDEPANISCGEHMAGALKGILNLYNQEKEKNKNLKEGIRQIKDKLEIVDYYNCQDGADELTRLLQES